MLSAEDDKIIIKKANKRKDINELFYGFNEEYQPIDRGRRDMVRQGDIIKVDLDPQVGHEQAG